MSDPPAATDRDDAVVGEVPCLRCGYNLHSLNPTGKCPECGLEIALSLHGGELSRGDPLWVATLSLGALFAAVLSGLDVVVWLLSMNLLAIGEGLFYHLYYTLYVSLPIAWTVAIWLITEPQRESPLPEPDLSLRRMTRVTVIVCTSMILVFMSGVHMEPTVSRPAWLWGGTAWSLLCLLEIAFFYVYIRRLGVRGSDLYIVTHAPVLMGFEIVAMAIAQLLPWSLALLQELGFRISTPRPGLGSFWRWWPASTARSSS